MINKAGNKSRSIINAEMKASEEKSTNPCMGIKKACNKTKKPRIRLKDVMINANPTVSKAYITASSALRFFSLFACRYLLRKCTVKSTIIPKVVPIPIATSILISLLTIAQIPKATPIGKSVVTEVYIPYLRDLKNRMIVAVIKTIPIPRA